MHKLLDSIFLHTSEANFMKMDKRIDIKNKEDCPRDSLLCVLMNKNHYYLKI